MTRIHTNYSSASKLFIYIYGCSFHSLLCIPKTYTEQCLLHMGRNGTESVLQQVRR